MFTFNPYKTLSLILILYLTSHYFSSNMDNVSIILRILFRHLKLVAQRSMLCSHSR